VFDVAVDIRVGSPHFGKWVGAVLSETNHHALFIPRGFAHGFVVRSETADFLYKCSDYYDAADDCGILWNDPALGIAWNELDPVLSARDKSFLPLGLTPHNRLPVYTP
jgi:dTDP-4-dehydrorhamnose 3,5-epimerase